MTDKTLASPTGAPEIDTAHSHESDWLFAEGVPGVGIRPDYLESKYKSVADQAKAYKEAQKLIGSNASAPESYDFGDLRESIDQDNPHIQELITYAKEARLQQDSFGKIVKKFVDYDESKKPNVDQEIAKLGADGANKITTLQNWVKNNLSADAAKALEALPVKAEVVQMLDELRQKFVHTQSKLPGGVENTSTFKVLTVKEVEQEMLNNYQRYQNDPGYRQKITDMFEQAVG